MPAPRSFPSSRSPAQNTQLLTVFVSQAAYIFAPEDEDDGPRQRPSKRRRVSKKAKQVPKQAGPEFDTVFVPLLKGLEGWKSLWWRKEIYLDCWTRVESKIQVRVCCVCVPRPYRLRRRGGLSTGVAC
jgi:hypothetical protein